jgi:cytochrome P450
MSSQLLSVRDLLTDRYGCYQQLRTAGGVTWMPDLMGSGAFLLTGYKLCSRALRDRSLGRDAFAAVPPEVIDTWPDEELQRAECQRLSMFFQDPPGHTYIRRHLNGWFTHRAAAVTSRIRSIAARFVDDLPVGSADLVADFAFPLPILVIAELLGASPADRDLIRTWSTALLTGIDPSTAQQAEHGQALAEMDEYIAQLLDARRRQPREDLVSDLARDPGGLTDEQLIANIRTLIVGGHETTTNLIANGLLALLTDDRQRQVFIDDESCRPNAVDELLRFESPLQATHRYARADLDLGPARITRGSLVIPVIGAANRDPSQFDEPNKLWLRRPNASRHLAFGGGPHYCLGAALARSQAQIAIETVLDRLPDVTVDKPAVTWRPQLNLRAMEQLPVTVMEVQCPTPFAQSYRSTDTP